MARTTRHAADPTRRAAFVSGLFYLITFASSIPAALLLAPILTDPGYITGAGADRQIAIASLLDLTNALTALGSAVAVFSVLRRYHESLALGFVATRLLEAAIIVPGICALLAVTAIRQAGVEAGADSGSLVAVGQGLVGFRNWTFILGPGLIPGFNALMFATVLYRARLVPRWIPALGLIGAPLLISSVMGMVLGFHELDSPYAAIATAPIFVWELSVGLWMTFKGFNRDATVRTAASDAGDPDASAPREALAGPVSVPAPASARFARLRYRPQRRHLLFIPGLLLAILGNVGAGEHGVGIATVLLFSALPSLPLLLGIGQRRSPGRVAARAILPFNLTHEPILALGAFALGVVGVLPIFAQDGALVWLGSIVMSWGLGDGLRAGDGSLHAGLRRLTAWPGVPFLGRGAAAA